MLDEATLRTTSRGVRADAHRSVVAFATSIRCRVDGTEARMRRTPTLPPWRCSAHDARTRPETGGLVGRSVCGAPRRERQGVTGARDRLHDRRDRLRRTKTLRERLRFAKYTTGVDLLQGRLTEPPIARLQKVRSRRNPKAPATSQGGNLAGPARPVKPRPGAANVCGQTNSLQIRSQVSKCARPLNLAYLRFPPLPLGHRSTLARLHRLASSPTSRRPSRLKPQPVRIGRG